MLVATGPSLFKEQVMSSKVVVQKGFIEVDGKMVWREEIHYPISDTGCIFVTYNPLKSGDDEQHLIYKLAHIPSEHGQPEPEKRWFWSALWNSCARTHGIHTTMEGAIREMLDDGWVVKQTVFSKLCPFLKRENL